MCKIIAACVGAAACIAAAVIVIRKRAKNG